MRGRGCVRLGTNIERETRADLAPFVLGLRLRKSYTGPSASTIKLSAQRHLQRSSYGVRTICQKERRGPRVYGAHCDLLVPVRVIFETPPNVRDSTRDLVRRFALRIGTADGRESGRIVKRFHLATALAYPMNHGRSC